MSQEVAVVFALAAQTIGVAAGFAMARGRWTTVHVIALFGWGLVWFVMKVSGVTV